MQEKYLVLGASGTVGKDVVSLLKKQGCYVRTTTSKPNKVTKDCFLIDFTAPRTDDLNKVFDQIDRVFLLSPGGFGDQYKILAPLIRSAKQHQIKKVVLMTSVGVYADLTSGYRRAEIELEQSGLSYTIIRPNWFMQNFSSYWLGAIKQQNKILLPAGDAKTSFISTYDVAQVAVKLLTSDLCNKAILDLTGSEALDHHAVAAVISKYKTDGKKVNYQEITKQEFKDTLLKAGLAEDYVNFLVLIMSAAKSGQAAKVTDTVKQILGREPVKFEEYVESQAETWS